MSARTFIMKWFGGLADQAPSSESVIPAIGLTEKAAREDHRHQRLTSATAGTLDVLGEATVTFTRSFATMPCVDAIPIEAVDNGAVVFKVKSWVMTGPNYTGCVLKGYRFRPLPAVLTLLTQLLSFRVDQGDASNVSFTIIALERSA